MEITDISSRVRNLIRFGLIILLAISGTIGYGAFRHIDGGKEIHINDAKVTGTLVAMRTLVNGKVNEVLFNDGDSVNAGDVIARLEVSVTEEDIRQLESAVEMAKENYETIQLGQIVMVPVRRVKMIPAPMISTTPSEDDPTLRSNTQGQTGSATLSSLEERANRMEELYEMGAVSAKERDAARQAYEDALINGLPSPEPAPQTSSGLIMSEEIEYVEQFQPPSPAALQNAENAIRQAELSLKVAIQESHETEITTPVSGTIYYTVANENEVDAGDTVAKVGDSNDLWIAAEVSEEVFEKVPLGKVVNYTIAGKKLSGTVIEKIAPYAPDLEADDEEVDDTKTSLSEIISAYNLPHDEIKSESVELVEEEPQSVNDNATVNKSEEKTSLEEITSTYNVPQKIQPSEKIPTEELQPDTPINDKYILKFSLPTERDFECKPNTSTTVKVVI